MNNSNPDIEKIEGFLTQIKIDKDKARCGDNMWSFRQGTAHVFIITAGGFIIFQSVIATVPKQNLTYIYRKCLELNDNATETLGTSFGINPHNEIVIKALYPINDMTFSSFSYFLTSLAHVANKYIKFFKEKL